MSRFYLLDTNTVIYILRGRSPAARTRLSGLESGEIASISVITEGELLYGYTKSGTGDKPRRALESFLARMRVLAWGRQEAAAYGLLRARQERMGRALAPLDTQIAAHAVSTGAILVTNDKAFHHVPDLAGVENWATDL